MTLGQRAYSIYVFDRGDTRKDGTYFPKWNELPPAVQGLWEAAARSAEQWKMPQQFDV